MVEWVIVHQWWDQWPSDRSILANWKEIKENSIIFKFSFELEWANLIITSKGLFYFYVYISLLNFVSENIVFFFGIGSNNIKLSTYNKYHHFLLVFSQNAAADLLWNWITSYVSSHTFSTLCGHHIFLHDWPFIMCNLIFFQAIRYLLLLSSFFFSCPFFLTCYPINLV